jgi:hypothetical protein
MMAYSACGGAFCGDCSPQEVPLPQFGLIQKQRVCLSCYAAIYAEMKEYTTYCSLLIAYQSHIVRLLLTYHTG